MSKYDEIKIARGRKDNLKVKRTISETIRVISFDKNSKLNPIWIDNGKYCDVKICRFRCAIN